MFCSSKFPIKRLICNQNLLKCSQFATTARQSWKQHFVNDSPLATDDSFHIFPTDGTREIGHGARVTLLSKDMQKENLMSVFAVSAVGFRLVDTSFLFGPIALFPKTALSWRVHSPEEITPESLELFFLLQPKLDVLVVGVGESEDIDAVRKRVAPTIAKHRIGYEIMDSENAAALFNFLNNEHRYVGAALFPPREMQVRAEEFSEVLRQFHEAEIWDLESRTMGIISLMDSLAAGEDDDFELRSACYRIWGVRSEKAEEMIQKMIGLRKDNEKRRYERLAHKIKSDRMERHLEIEKRRQIEEEKGSMLKLEEKGKNEEKNE